MNKKSLIFFLMFFCFHLNLHADEDLIPSELNAEPISEPEVKNTEVPTEETTAKQITSDYSADEPLPSPTANIEVYEEKRMQRFKETNTPKWSIGFTMQARAFKQAEFRKPDPTGRNYTGKSPSQKLPRFKGVMISGERILFQKLSLLAIGVELGTYSSTGVDGYSNLFLGLISVGPYANYQLKFFDNQWIIPTGHLKYETVLQNYSYTGNKNKNISFLARVDLGLMFYLNFLDIGDSSQMSANYGIKKTYLEAFWTTAKDLNKNNLSLNEHTWRAGFRFEF